MDSSLRRFANSVIVEANERVVLSEPLDPTCLANRQLSPAVQPHADALRSGHHANLAADLGAESGWAVLQRAGWVRGYTRAHFDDPRPWCS